MTNTTELYEQEFNNFMDGLDNGNIFSFGGKTYVPAILASEFDTKGTEFMPDRENKEQQAMFGFDTSLDENEDIAWIIYKNVEYVPVNPDVKGFKLFEKMKDLNKIDSIEKFGVFINYAISNTFKLKDEDNAQKELLNQIKNEGCFLVDGTESIEGKKLVKLAVPIRNYKHFKWGDFIIRNKSLYLLSDDFDLEFYARLCYAQDLNLADALISLKYADYKFKTTAFDVE